MHRRVLRLPPLQGKAVQVDNQVDPGLKALGFQLLELFESTSLSKLWFQHVNLHPYIAVKNFLREITQRVITVKRRAFPVPRVLIQGDPVLRTFRDQGLYVKSAVTVPEGAGVSPNCSVPYPEMDFKWGYDLSTVGMRNWP